MASSTSSGYDSPNYYKTIGSSSAHVTTPSTSTTHYDLNRIQYSHDNNQSVSSHSTQREMHQMVPPSMVPVLSSNHPAVVHAHDIVQVQEPVLSSLPIIQEYSTPLPQSFDFSPMPTVQSMSSLPVLIIPQNPVYSTMSLAVAPNLPDMQSISSRINKLNKLNKTELDKLLSDMKKHKENLSKLNEKVFNNIKKTEGQINVVLNSLKDEVKESDNKLNSLIIPSHTNDQKVIEKEIDEEYAKTLHHHGLRGSFKQLDNNALLKNDISNYIN